MAEPTNSKAQAPSSEDARRRTDQQKTLLLSDVPEATALILEPSPTASAIPHLSAAALAALSQRYDILAEAGHGSMGNVYKARDRETGETVALKLLKPEIASDQAMMDRFKNELLFARKITHKNVCRVHEFNRINGIAYTSMEFVEGESLRSVLNRFGGLPLRKAIDLVGQICSGLKEAHVQGIVHRDLKPENVMIDAQGNVKIMDFGIARSMEAGTRLTGAMVGTPAYMAPEQVAGKPVDYRTDIYALGLIVYEVFTGAPAFRAENAVAVALKQMREAPTPPHEVEPTVPVSIERVILKCLEKEPPKRFQSMAELEIALRVPGAPAAAPPPVIFAPSPMHATPTAPILSSAPETNRPSPVVWVLMLALLVVGTYAGWRWVQAAQAADDLPAPAPLAAPVPPDFAIENPGAQTPAAAPVAAAPEAAQPAEPKPAAPVKSAAPVPTKHIAANAPAPVRTRPQPAPPEVSPQAVQRRADKAFGENEPVSVPPVNDHTPSYLWVGRFDREERAQITARKIEGLGLPVAVIPRHNANNSEFYVVFTGPFGPERVESVMDWLKTQGFPGVRLVKNPLGNKGQSPN